MENIKDRDTELESDNKNIEVNNENELKPEVSEDYLELRQGLMTLNYQNDPIKLSEKYFEIYGKTNRLNRLKVDLTKITFEKTEKYLSKFRKE